MCTHVTYTYMITFIFYCIYYTFAHIRFNRKRCDHRHTLNVTHANVYECNRTESCRDFVKMVFTRNRNINSMLHSLPATTRQNSHSLCMFVYLPGFLLMPLRYFRYFFSTLCSSVQQKLIRQFAECNARRTYCK